MSKSAVSVRCAATNVDSYSALVNVLAQRRLAVEPSPVKELWDDPNAVDIANRNRKAEFTELCHRLVTEKLWDRIRHGPSALENATIRHVVVNGNYRLKPVQTRQVKGPVIRDVDHQRGVLPAIVSFNKATLRHVETEANRLSESTPLLTVEWQAAVSRVPSKQRVATKEKKSAEPPAFDRDDLLAEIKLGVQLNHVADIDAKAESKKSPGKVGEQNKGEPTAEQLKAALTNVDKLVELGFTNKRANFLALMKTGNDLVAAVLLRLSVCDWADDGELAHMTALLGRPA